MQIPRWQNLMVLKNTLVIPPFAPSSSATHFSLFHSTPTTCDKWKNKWRAGFDVKGREQPSKTYVKYAIRQKRSDAKRVLKDLLFRNGCTKFSFQDEDPMGKFNGASNWETEQADHSNYSGKKNRLKFTRGAGKAYHKKQKRRLRRESFSEDFDNNPEKIFEASFGNRWYTWSFNSWQDSSFQGSTSGFEWREQSKWSNNRSRKWNTSSDSESDYEQCDVGSCSDRTVLGLPPAGPLKIEDVKNAFRLSALKWHPDKHQGPSQAPAEEKFKLCVNAYKSLCNALSV